MDKSKLLNKNYFSSDWHLGHKNILLPKYDHRPFSTIDDHDKTILGVALSTLREGDNFYNLGDFSFANKAKTEEYLKTLASSRANLFFIKGNHDKSDTIKLYEKYGTYLGEQKMIKINNQEIMLNHFKMAIWDKSHHGSWHLYGHSHGNAEKWVIGKSMDLAINYHGYKLLEFEDIKKEMDSREILTFDHHHSRTRE